LGSGAKDADFAGFVVADVDVFDDGDVGDLDVAIFPGDANDVDHRAAEDADLSLIQLKSKQTPVNTHIFTFTDDPLEIDQELYMIGYNAGLILANTQKGISVQMTSGKVTQNPDSSRILYSIPTVQGSSGSPVLNKYGEVVGVNFAKLKASDNFNFAIPQSRKDAIGL
jgi:S1-C subfamily serine protease